MALKDLRSFIFKIYGMTESYDMKVITYGQGLNQVLYGLTQEPRFFGNTTNEIIAFAPCVYWTTDAYGMTDYDTTLAKFKDYGVYSISDPYWLVNYATICQAENLSQDACDLAQSYAKSGVATSVKALEYLNQLAIAQQYQEFKDDFTTSNSKTDLIIPAKELLDYKYPLEPPTVIPTSDASTEEPDTSTDDTDGDVTPDTDTDDVVVPDPDLDPDADPLEDPDLDPDLNPDVDPDLDPLTDPDLDTDTDTEDAGTDENAEAQDSANSGSTVDESVVVYDGWTQG
jgi:hypothetical protein